MSIAENRLFDLYEHNRKELDASILDIKPDKYMELQMMNHILLALARIEQELDGIRLVMINKK